MKDKDTDELRLHCRRVKVLAEAIEVMAEIESTADSTLCEAACLLVQEAEITKELACE